MNVIEKYPELFTKPFAVKTVLAICRIVVGAVLVYHGQQKVMGNVDDLASMLQQRGWPLPWFQAFAASYIEFAGGVLLIVGLFTRPVALSITLLFFVIVVVFHGADAFSTKELGILYLMFGALFFATGGGRFSVDHYLFRKGEGS
jgi:putative oxidoreductase